MRFSLCIVFCLLFVPFATAQESSNPYNVALQRIQDAQAKGETFLDLRNLGLTEIPSEIGQLENLQGLGLSDNLLSSLPPEIALLQNLCFLDIRNNRFQYLPTSLAQIETLFLPPATCPFEGMGLALDGNPLISPPETVINQGGDSILTYLRNESAWSLPRPILIGIGIMGLVVALILGLRWLNTYKDRKSKTYD